MQLNLSQLRTQTRFKTDISNTSTLTNAQIDTQLNEGYSKLIRAIVETDGDYFEEQKAKFNLIANSSLYSLPADCIKVKQVRLAYTTPTSESDYAIAGFYDPSESRVVSIDETNVPASNPQVDITNNYCRVFPRPTANSTSGGEYYYIARPSALTATGDVMVIPADYHDLAVVWASYKIMERFENFVKADRYKLEFEGEVAKMKNDLSGREMNKERRFRSSKEQVFTNRRELPN